MLTISRIHIYNSSLLFSFPTPEKVEDDDEEEDNNTKDEEDEKEENEEQKDESQAASAPASSSSSSSSLPPSLPLYKGEEKKNLLTGLHVRRLLRWFLSQYDPSAETDEVGREGGERGREEKEEGREGGVSPDRPSRSTIVAVVPFAI